MILIQAAPVDTSSCRCALAAFGMTASRMRASRGGQNQRMMARKMSWRRETVTSGDVRLSVRDSGAQGRPLLLIHGLGLTQRSWARVAGRLTKRFRVVTYDQRGHGASSPARDYSPSAF